ncbi:MAG TPA: hypothetical protein VF077_12525 [Nitrospiraceae bacterium]
MAFFPSTPTPSSISAPAIIDPMWRFEADAGIDIRRAKHSRPRRRYVLDYLGKTTTEMRTIRDFLQQQRLGVLAFQWFHSTAIELCTIDGTTTPAGVYFEHGLVTGQWIGIIQGPAVYNAFWQVTRFSHDALTLNGSAGNGSVANAFAFVYLPTAVGIFGQDFMASPDKLIGPEQWYPAGYVTRVGYWNFSVQIEEIF